MSRDEASNNTKVNPKKKKNKRNYLNPISYYFIILDLSHNKSLIVFYIKEWEDLSYISNKSLLIMILNK